MDTTTEHVEQTLEERVAALETRLALLEEEKRKRKEGLARACREIARSGHAWLDRWEAQRRAFDGVATEKDKKILNL